MTKKIAPIPKGYRSATPVLVVRGADAALAYYETIFGASIISRAYAQDGITVIQAEMKIGNSIIRVRDELPAFGLHSPAAFGGTAASIHLYLEDADSVWTRALESGAVVAVPLAETYWGEQFGSFIDPYGHAWSIARRVEVLSKAEIAARADALFNPAPAALNADEEIEPAIEGAASVEIVSETNDVAVVTAQEEPAPAQEVAA